MRGGFPISVYVQGDVCNCAAYSKRALDVGDPYSGFTRSRLQWFNTAAFVQPVSGRFGNSGHNILSGPRGKTVSFPVFGSHKYPNKNIRQAITIRFFNKFHAIISGIP